MKNLIFNDFDANPYLSKAYFISSFISGLKELKILKPTSFKSLMKLNGRKSIFSMARKNKFVSGMGDECNETSGRGK